MKFSINYEVTRTYYASEVIEAESLEKAEAIAKRLLDSTDFVDWLDDTAEYDGRETSLLYVSKTDEGVTLDENDYLEEE